MHDLAAVDVAAHELRVAPQLVRRLRNAFYKQSLPMAHVAVMLDPPEMARLIPRLRHSFLSLLTRQDSPTDGASKLAFATQDGLTVESVILRIRSGRASLCVSTQVGCPLACAFCATGRSGFTRNLSRDEIIDQVIQANRLLAPEARRVRNVVFMGMGEPLLNEDSVYAALEVVRSERCLYIPDRYLTVSTAGIPNALLRLAERYPRVNLALSLHTTNTDIRERLMPVARHHSLSALRQALLAMAPLRPGPLLIEYIPFQGLNDSESDADSLADWLGGIPAHINLIPWNTLPNVAGLIGAGLESCRQFGLWLKARGFKVTLRRSLGQDIAAACGQLAGERSGYPEKALVNI